MKYRKEIDAILRELLFEDDWMDENDYKEVLFIMEKVHGLSYQQLDDEIEVGVKNGYSVEHQLDLVRKLILT